MYWLKLLSASQTKQKKKGGFSKKQVRLCSRRLARPVEQLTNLLQVSSKNRALCRDKQKVFFQMSDSAGGHG